MTNIAKQNHSQKQVHTFEYFTDERCHDFVKKTMYVPEDVWSEHEKIKTCSRLYVPFDTKDLVDFFIENGAYLYGKNAVEKFDAFRDNELKVQEDYDSAGNFLGKRSYTDGDLGRIINSGFSVSHVFRRWYMEVPPNENTPIEMKKSFKWNNDLGRVSSSKKLVQLKESIPCDMVDLIFDSREETGHAKRPKLQLMPLNPEVTVSKMTLLHANGKYLVTDVMTDIGETSVEQNEALTKAINVVLEDPQNVPEYLKTVVDIIMPVEETRIMGLEYRNKYAALYPHRGSAKRLMA